MTPAELSRTVLITVRRAVDAAELAVEVPEKVLVQRPPRAGCGDYATNVALQLAGPAGRSPHEVAEILRRRLAREPGIAGVRIAGAGFLNITLSSRAYDVVVRQVREQREAYGRGEGLGDERLTVAAADGAVRGLLVAEVVNGLLRAAGAHPVDPGTPPERLDVAEPAEPSRTAPTPLTFAALASTLGSDAARWALLRPPAEDAPRLDPDARAALLTQREANPLFRVRYAHARTRALLRNAHDLDIPDSVDQDACTVEGVATDRAPATAAPDSGDPALPAPSDPTPPYHPAETELLGLIADFPRVVESAARRRGPDRVARHLERLADAFARFHDECGVLPKGDEKPSAVHAARLRLTDAAGIVLANGLHQLGISAPDRI
ncbi:arginyl-tRNA synthetase [Actinacidiphila yanglinensis]|uniref:arginine--tRNA ligase n=1 Tax=Actinacidiphila yanglinensis TaxID=310779 RepID=A0A1H5VUX6_9ACTN|nr:DALR anticodon-binding domain-containing protein [Actinacidiphila yanglinensis]SEF91034.1 arginyl-tRNA synthetase [Actinacidiphila yanglinensis]